MDLPIFGRRKVVQGIVRNILVVVPKPGLGALPNLRQGSEDVHIEYAGEVAVRFEVVVGAPFPIGYTPNARNAIYSLTFLTSFHVKTALFHQCRVRATRIEMAFQGQSSVSHGT